jgi:hypothetical protein
MTDTIEIEIPAEFWAELKTVCDIFVDTGKLMPEYEIYKVIRKYFPDMDWHTEELLMGPACPRDEDDDGDDGLVEDFLREHYEVGKVITVEYELTKKIG